MPARRWPGTQLPGRRRRPTWRAGTRQQRTGGLRRPAGARPGRGLATGAARPAGPRHHHRLRQLPVAARSASPTRPAWPAPPATTTGCCSPPLITDPNGNQTVGWLHPARPARLDRPHGPAGRRPGRHARPAGHGIHLRPDRLGRQPGPPASRCRCRPPAGSSTAGRWSPRPTRSAPQQGLPPLTDAQIAAMFPPDEGTQYPARFVQKTEFTDGFSRGCRPAPRAMTSSSTTLA